MITHVPSPALPDLRPRSAAGWSCSAAHRRPRTPSCWCSGTRTRCCAGTLAAFGTSQPTGPGSPRSCGSSRGGAGPGLSGDARDAAGLAPQAGRQEIRHEHPAPSRPPADSPQHRPARHPAGGREPAVGIPPYSWRADQAGRDNRAVHRLGDPALLGYRSRAPPGRPDLAAVPVFAGRRDPRRRLPSRRYRC
jgi:hypothetical protein